MQVVHRRATVPIEEVTLDPQRDALEQVREWLEPHRQRLDLRQAPLIRLRIAADCTSACWYALLQFHHIGGDNTSQEAIVADVVAQLEGRTQELPDSVPYREHVAQSLAYASKHDFAGFFRAKLGDIDEPTAPFGLIDVHGDGAQS